MEAEPRFWLRVVTKVFVIYLLVTVTAQVSTSQSPDNNATNGSAGLMNTSPFHNLEQLFKSFPLPIVQDVNPETLKVPKPPSPPKNSLINLLTFTAPYDRINGSQNTLDSSSIPKPVPSTMLAMANGTAEYLMDIPNPATELSITNPLTSPYRPFSNFSIAQFFGLFSKGRSLENDEQEPKRRSKQDSKMLWLQQPGKGYNGVFPNVSPTRSSVKNATASCKSCELECGLARPLSSNLRLVGGVNVTPSGKYPWVVLLTYFLSPSGEGSLISERTVVTSGSIIQAMPLTSGIAAVFNVSDQSSNSEQRLIKKVAYTVLHPNFVEDNPFQHNIGLVVLRRREMVGVTLMPICMPTTFQSYDNKQGIVAAWGPQEIGGERTRVLQEVVLPLYGRDACQEAYPLTATRNNICGGILASSAGDGAIRSTCEGDGGSGLMFASPANSSILTIIGVTLDIPNVGCGKANQPAVFTNIRGYIPWINSKSPECRCPENAKP